MSYMINISKFKNINGITCYMNSILNILYQTPYFITFILNKEFIINIKNKKSVIMINELYSLFKTTFDNPNSIIEPVLFKHKAGLCNNVWNENNQQDSQEFLLFILNQLQENIYTNYDILYEYNNKNIKLHNISQYIYNIYITHSYLKSKIYECSKLSLLFKGCNQIINKCSLCKSKSYNIDQYLTFTLEIPNQENLSLYDCFDEFFKLEKYMNKCTFCGLNTVFYKQQLLYDTPEILIICLMKFKYNNEYASTNKITSNINYPLYDLNLEKYFSNNSKQKSKYNLFAVNIHNSINSSINSGHYISIVKNRISNKWYLYNDEHVEEVSDEKNIQSSNAYLLFYQQNTN